MPWQWYIKFGRVFVHTTSRNTFVGMQFKRSLYSLNVLEYAGTPISTQVNSNTVVVAQHMLYKYLRKSSSQTHSLQQKINFVLLCIPVFVCWGCWWICILLIGLFHLTSCLCKGPLLLAVVRLFTALHLLQ